VAARPASASELCECTSKYVGSQRDTRRGSDSVQDLLYTKEVPASGLVRISGGKEPRREPLEILCIPILLIPQMNSDENLLEC
jgi:hypothetical protein